MWTILGSLTFGFCSIWSLHFVAMLACELDLPIGIDVGLTILSAILAVAFTFVALGSDLLTRIRWNRRRSSRSRRSSRHRYKRSGSHVPDSNPSRDSALDAWEGTNGDVNDEGEESHEGVNLLRDHVENRQGHPELHNGHDPGSKTSKQAAPDERPPTKDPEESEASSDLSTSRRSSLASSANSSHGLANIVNIAQRSAMPARNAFKITGEALHDGFTWTNVIKGFLWSLAITGMHYVGIAALRVPEGHYTLSVRLVILSAIISWIVCLVGVIMMSRMETHLTQQLLFSVVASIGVAAMHSTGA